MCTKKCLTNFSKDSLSNHEKICLNKCFGRNMDVTYLNMSKIDDFSKKY